MTKPGLFYLTSRLSFPRHLVPPIGLKLFQLRENGSRRRLGTL